MAQELCYRASIDGNDEATALEENAREKLYQEFSGMMEQIRRGRIYPCYCIQRR